MRLCIRRKASLSGNTVSLAAILASALIRFGGSQPDQKFHRLGGVPSCCHWRAGVRSPPVRSYASAFHLTVMVTFFLSCCCSIVAKFLEPLGRPFGFPDWPGLKRVWRGGLPGPTFSAGSSQNSHSSSGGLSGHHDTSPTASVPRDRPQSHRRADHRMHGSPSASRPPASDG